jgi:hypothetical protein
MKQIILTLIVLAFVTNVSSQTRESIVVPKYDMISDTLFKSNIKYYWKSQLGVWEEKNVTDKYLTVKSFIYNNKRFYVLFAYYDRTGYKYEALKQGAYARRTIAYHFYSESDFLNIKKSIQKTEKVDLKFKAICSGEIFSDMEGATDTRYGTYEFNEDYAIKKFLMDKNDKYTSTNTIIINSYYLDNKMITRYRIEISSIAASVGLNQQYYECDLVNFNKLFELHSIK